MNARSPWEHIGGCCLLGGVGLALYGGGWWSVLTIMVGVICIWLGWIAHKKRDAE